MSKSNPVKLGLGIVGPGLIGKALLGQLASQSPVLSRDFNIELHLLGVSNSKKMALAPSAASPIDWASWEKALASAGSEPANLDAFAAKIRSIAVSGGFAPLIVDNSASEVVAEKAVDWLRSGIHLVTPNKRLGAGPMDRYNAVRAACDASGAHFFYEATVGAGLPILSTLKHLQATGDRVHVIQGILSGTLSYLFNTFDPSVGSWSALVAQAKEAGYTEPDPRDDLSGLDVARKVVILARECGLDVTLEGMTIESLVPEPLRDVSTDEFMRRLPDFDAEMAARAREAVAAGEVLRYVGVVDVQRKSVSVQLLRFPRSHAFGGLQGTDNIVEFKTTRYHTNALIVRGPGAGAEVTAGGIFSDILYIANHLGSKQV